MNLDTGIYARQTVGDIESGSSKKTRGWLEQWSKFDAWKTLNLFPARYEST